MSFEVHKLRDAEANMAEKIRPGKRLCLTADKKRLVPDTDPKAATLYCNQYQTVDAEEYKRLKGPKPEDKRNKSETEDKGRESKSGSKGGDS